MGMTIDNYVSKELKDKKRKKFTSKDTLTMGAIRKAVKTLEKAEAQRMDEIYIVYYAWIKAGDQILCAWCKKDIKEIRFHNFHIRLHHWRQRWLG